MSDEEQEMSICPYLPDIACIEGHPGRIVHSAEKSQIWGTKKHTCRAWNPKQKACIRIMKESHEFWLIVDKIQKIKEAELKEEGKHE